MYPRTAWWGIRRRKTSGSVKQHVSLPATGAGEPRSVVMAEFGIDGVLEERRVAGHNRQPRRCDEVPALVLNRIVADHGAFGNMHVAVDDGAPSVVSTLRESLAISS